VENVLHRPERLDPLAWGGAGPGLLRLGLDVEVQPRESGLTVRPPRGVERDDPGDALDGPRRVGDPRRVLQEHRLDGQPEAGRRVVEQLTQPPDAVRVVHQEV
jgi:hypothetical protein